MNKKDESDNPLRYNSLTQKIINTKGGITLMEIVAVNDLSSCL